MKDNINSMFIQNKDGIESKIEYLGTMKLLDILIEKIKESYDINEIEKYCNLYKMIYELLGDKENE